MSLRLPGDRLRIGLVAACPFPSPQGSQVFVGQMATRLGAAGHDVHLVTYGQGVEQSGRGYRHHRIARLPGDDSSRSGPNLAKPLLDGMMASRLVRLVREQALDLLHAHNYEAAVAALVARAITGVPVVYHSHNLMGDELETYFERTAARRLAAVAGRFLDRQVPRRADWTIALCQWSAERLLAAGCRAERLSVIPPAVEDEGPLAVEAADRRALGLDESDFVVVYPGNLDAYQNLPLLLRAIRRVAGARPSRAAGARDGQGAVRAGQGAVRLLVVTHGDATELESEARRAGVGDAVRVVRATGHAEARRGMAVADVVALPRRLGSGYPVKLLNSMSAAKAIVAAGCGSKVLRDGVDGLVVPDDDEQALAAAIERCRRDPDLGRDLGQAARRTFLERLTWDAVLPQVEEVHARLARTRAKARHT